MPPGPSITELLDAWLRLVWRLDAPQDITVLAPLCEREILCLLRGPQGAIVRQIVRADSRLSQVHRATPLIHEQFDQLLRVEALTDEAA